MAKNKAIEIKGKAKTAKREAVNGERRAKLFKNGASQAVRLPKEFRFEGREVKIRRVKDGVLLEPLDLQAGAGDSTAVSKGIQPLKHESQR
jgi:virulence-associated protein VagC